MACYGVLTALVLAGALPLLAAFYQFAIIGRHARKNHYDLAGDYAPRCAIVVPAWNEGAVIGATIDRLVSLDYPAGVAAGVRRRRREHRRRRPTSCGRRC